MALQERATPVERLVAKMAALQAKDEKSRGRREAHAIANGVVAPKIPRVAWRTDPGVPR